MQQSPDLTVFYDGYCPLCSREIESYKRLKLDTNIVWRDLAADADALQNENFNMTQALKLLHIKDAQGTLHIGLAAHLVLWRQLPGFQWRTQVLGASAGLFTLCNKIYIFFTRHRPGLRRRARVQVKRATLNGARS